MQGLNFWEFAQRAPSHPAVIEPDGRVTSAGTLLRAANQVVHGLRARGFRRGDTLAVVLKNEVAMLELFMAAWQAGWYLTPINTHLTSHEIAYILEDCEARAVFCCDRTTDVTRKALALLGWTEQDCFATSDVPGLESYAALKAGQPDDPPPEPTAGATMTYTSGTAGQPKGVRRPLAPVAPERVGESFASFLGLFGIKPGDGGVHLTTSPLYHTAVLNFCTNHLHFGHTVVLMDKWTPEGTLELIARHRVTTTHMVPTLFQRLLALPADVKHRADVSSLRHVIHGAAPCPIEVKHEMLSWWGHVIYEYYAATEGGGTLATPEQWLAHPGTVGRAWPMSTLLVLRDDGTECEPGEVGTLYMRMGAHRFEYHKARQKTDSAWRGDFFTVGDAGCVDAEGFLYLRDRKSDFIISGGVNIYPAEIEMTLSCHPKVADAAILGVPDVEWGERIKAVIEPVPGAQPGPELAAELLAFCRERLASFKCPDSIDFTVALPRDPNGKLMKRKLRDS